MIFCFAIALAAFLLYGRFFGGWAGDMYVRLAKPFWNLAGYGYGGWRSVQDFFLSRDQLVLRVSMLSEENRMLREDAGELEALKTEYAALRHLFGNPPHSWRENAVVARVVGKGSHIFGQEIVLDRGASDDIGENDTVTVGDRSLVGRVYRVSPHYAYVTLLSNRNFRAGAKIFDGNAESEKSDDKALKSGKEGVLGSEGLVRGEGFGMITLDMVPSGALLNEGDTVLTSGFDGVFPGNLVIGKVERIVSSPSDFFQRASLSPAVDVGNIETVTIIKTPKVF